MSAWAEVYLGIMVICGSLLMAAIAYRIYKDGL